MEWGIYCTSTVYFDKKLCYDVFKNRFDRRTKTTTEECQDNPHFANCALIVRAKYCDNAYYMEYCCKSCSDAGQLVRGAVATDTTTTTVSPVVEALDEFW